MNWKKICWWGLWTVIGAMFLAAGLFFSKQGYTWHAAISLAFVALFGVALRKIFKANPSRSRRWAAVALITWAVILGGGLFLGSLPPTVRFTHQPQDSQCRNNLRLIAAVKTQWALENHKTADALPTQEDLLPYLGRSGWPECAAGGKYIIGIVSADPTCSKPGHVLPK